MDTQYHDYLKADSAPGDPTTRSDALPFVDWQTEEFYDILKFLAIPAVFAFLAIILGIIPRFGLYLFAAIYGMALLNKSSKNPEYLLAVFILYVPMSSMIPVSIVKGLNATNVFILLLIVMAFIDRKPKYDPSDSQSFDIDQIGVFPDVQPRSIHIF